MTGRDVAFGHVVQAGLARQVFGAECDEIALITHPLDRCGLGGDDLAVRGEDCCVRAEIAQQSCCTIGEGK